MTSVCKNYFYIQVLFSSTSVHPPNIHNEKILLTNSPLCCKQNKPREIAEIWTFRWTGPGTGPGVRNLISGPPSSHGHILSKEWWAAFLPKMLDVIWENRDKQFMFIFRNLSDIEAKLYIQDNIYKFYAVKLLCLYNKAQNYCNAIWTEQGKKH